MPRELKEITTKTGVVIKESYCRKCMQMRLLRNSMIAWMLALLMRTV